MAIIGLISAIAIPNLMNAIDQGKQKRTMADMRAIATASEAYRLDNETYPAGVTSIDELAEVIELKDHPWFLACQFHPEKSGKAGLAILKKWTDLYL